MRIQNNMMAVNTHRQLGTNALSQQKSTEKLSSGFRINRAADDASGLSISEKMRAQIKGLGQASANAQDGISLIQAAEGALQETHSILQRMRELSVKAANDINETEDRGAIKSELDQLTAEVDRIAYTTEFNKKTLLDGSLSNGSKAVQAGGENYMSLNVDETASAGFYGYTVTATATKASMDITALATVATDTGMDLGTLELCDEDGQKVTIGLGVINVDGAKTAAENAETIKGAIASALGDRGLSNQYTLKVSGAKVTIESNTAGKLDVAMKHTAGTAATNVKVPVDGVASTGATLTGANAVVAGTTGSLATAAPTVDNKGMVTDDKGISFRLDDATKTGKVNINVSTGSQLTLQVGANTGTNQTIAISVDRLSASGLGVHNLKVENHAQSQASIDAVEAAIQKVSNQRSDLGAVQNRLEHTTSNLDTVAENIQSAESRIRDVDMAKEMMNYTKSNILNQAATAMLAQANQAPQSVLQLLG